MGLIQKFSAIAFLAVAMLFCAAPARAAQEAVVGVEQAAIRERPTLDSKIIESKPTGATVRVSSFSKDGWYKTKSSIGQYGWIWQGDLTLQTSTADMKAANLVTKETDHVKRSGAHVPWLHIKLGGTFFPMLSPDLADTLGQTRQYFWLAFGAWGEVQVNLLPTLRLGARVQTFSSSASISNLGVNYTVNMSATPFLLGLEQDVSRSEYFSVTVALYGGLSLGNQLTVAVPSNPAPNSASISNSSEPDFLINIGLHYDLLNWMELVGDAGYFYTFVKGPFVSTNGTIATTINRYNMDGLITNVGVQFNF